MMNANPGAGKRAGFLRLFIYGFTPTNVSAMARRFSNIDPSLIHPDTYIRLDIAARLAFPDGSIGISCLRGEAKRGRLVVWRVGNKDMTTLAEVAKMVELCRVLPSPRDSGSGRVQATERQHGSFSTEDANTARDAALLRVKKLKDGLGTKC